MLRPIKTEAQHKAALKRIDKLIDATKPEEVAELSVLAILVETFERGAFPIAPPSALDAIRFRRKQDQRERF